MKNVKKFRIYFQALNILTFTSYTGLDPMVSINTRDDLEMGTDYNQYPPSPTYLIGVNLTL